MRQLVFILSFTLLSGWIVAQDTTRVYAFGHSLMDHRPPAVSTPSDETTIFHWLYLLAKAAEEPLQAGGQYGFLPQHRNVPPFAQWGYDTVPGCWESDFETFAAADITDILITAGNFIQYQSPAINYFNETFNPIDATVDIADWVLAQGDMATIYIYENWPEMTGLANAFPPISPSQQELDDYYNYTANAFHDWWIEYHDSLRSQVSETDIRMIPVGPILVDLYYNTAVGNILTTDLYEDADPHGRPNTYFLAAMAVFMSMFEEPTDSNFDLPSILSPEIRNNYLQIRDRIWDYLLAFNDAQGNSRVFVNQPIPTNTDIYIDANSINIYPNPTEDVLSIEGNLELYRIDVLDAGGIVHQSYGISPIEIDVSALPDGLYFIRIENIADQTFSFQNIIKQ